MVWPTGTLTENRMTVVEGWFAGHMLDHTPTFDELPPDLMNEIKLNIALSSKVCIWVLGLWHCPRVLLGFPVSGFQPLHHRPC